MTDKETLKLALDDLMVEYDMERTSFAKRVDEIFKQALAAPVQDSTCNNSLREQGKAYPRTCKKCKFGPCIALANLALDKKAENARELGLDYEPVQEPLEYWTAVEGWVKIDEVREHFDSVGCGTIYKTAGDGRVPLTAAQRKPLTDEQRQELMSKAWNEWLSRKDDGRLFAWSFSFEVEAAHGIKENT